MGGILTKIYNFVFREDVIIYSGELQKKINIHNNDIYTNNNTNTNSYNRIKDKEIIWIL
jgi:hypothetical protein